ncbi:hypothetical protein CLU83_1411 [Flavobacterium sp. 1]|uniref:hypothetical protein n=1 Tax=Flavobacterium sp. 1 TaxID=2035200 RepID=UPI000C23D290|nr:hypothetical protein [Flavobacterium sp. 1]PJJ08164.1 hypothetical protein CLU83_1411 [Flavobacterium sp. 1]
MDSLLKNDFTSFHQLPISILNIRQDTILPYFELEDIDTVLTLSSIKDSGTAKYTNPNNLEVIIIDYDTFLTSLSHRFRQGKSRCDAIVYTQNKSYFLLNELKNRKIVNENAFEEVLSGAISQMLKTLTLIKSVPSIDTFINPFTQKRCCYCNKQSINPSPIIDAPNAFNRLNNLAPDGIEMEHSEINALGFQLFQYTGAQTIKLN